MIDKFCVSYYKPGILLDAATLYIRDVIIIVCFLI